MARDLEEVSIDLQPHGGETQISGQITGYQTIDYLVKAQAGQTLAVEMKTKHLATSFNVLPPGSNDVAIFIGSTAGNSFSALLDESGTYKIRLYMMRSAARRNEKAKYTLKLALKGSQVTDLSRLGAPVVPYGTHRWDLELQGIRFMISSTDKGSINHLKIVPTGLEIDNRTIELEIDGRVQGLEVADLDADGSPELYIYVTSAGSGSYGVLIAYAANRRKSLSQIYLLPLDDTPASQGYMGHDEFAVVENRLVRRFPLYQLGDTNAAPTGGMRQLQYRLCPGENGWRLEVDKVVDY